jgi:hypothetical protein
MDGRRFDRLTRAMGGAATRRKAIGGLLAVAAAAALGATGVSAANGGAGKGHGKGNGKGHGKGNGHNKVAICHALGNGEFQFKRVPKPALKGHVKHGDTHCPADTDCTTSTGCNQATGDCMQSFADAGTPCSTDNVETGTCDGNGNCIAG